MSDLTQMPSRMRALLFLNGIGLFVAAILFGWAWFFYLLGEITVWPLPINIEVDIPGDSRAFRMGHMEGITHGLLLMGLAFGGQFMRMSERKFQVLFWAGLTNAWLFTLPAMANTFFGTRGLAFGGGPFKASVANDVIFLFGWPPIVAVHILLVVAIIGVYGYLKQQSSAT